MSSNPAHKLIVGKNYFVYAQGILEKPKKIVIKENSNGAISFIEEGADNEKDPYTWTYANHDEGNFYNVTDTRIQNFYDGTRIEILDDEEKNVRDLEDEARKNIQGEARGSRRRKRGSRR